MNTKPNQLCLCILGISVLCRMRQEDCDLEVSLGYMVMTLSVKKITKPSSSELKLHNELTMRKTVSVLNQLSA